MADVSTHNMGNWARQENKSPNKRHAFKSPTPTHETRYAGSWANRSRCTVCPCTVHTVHCQTLPTLGVHCLTPWRATTSQPHYAARIPSPSFSARCAQATCHPSQQNSSSVHTDTPASPRRTIVGSILAPNLLRVSALPSQDNTENVLPPRRS